MDSASTAVLAAPTVRPSARSGRCGVLPRSCGSLKRRWFRERRLRWWPVSTESTPIRCSWRKLQLAGKLIEKRSKRSHRDRCPLASSNRQRCRAATGNRCGGGCDDTRHLFGALLLRLHSHSVFQGTGSSRRQRRCFRCYGWCWSVCCDDCSSGKHAHLDCGGRDRHAAWLHRVERTGADGAGAGTALRSRLCFPWPPRRSDQGFVVRWRRAVQSLYRKPTISSFEPRQVCYPWHRWYGRSVLTRKAGGAHADVAYFCKLPEAPLMRCLLKSRSGCSMRPIARRCVFAERFLMSIARRCAL